MPALVRKYPIGKSRLKRSLLEGFIAAEGGSLLADEQAGRHTVFLHCLDGSQRGCEWGRFAFEADLGGDMAVAVGAFASDDPIFTRNGEIASFEDFLMDPEEPYENKLKLFKAAGGLRTQGGEDVLLTGLSGRYLWIYVELLGAGRAKLKNLRVYSPEDNFFNTFPEAYRSDNEFFRRYLSIFNSLYADFQDRIDSLDGILDIDTAPAGLLPVFAQWLGLELDGNFLEEEQLRRILKEAFHLISLKGTRAAVEGVARALLDEPVYIVEQGLTGAWGAPSQSNRPRPYDFTVLLNCPADEKLHSRLKYLIDQFKPVRSRVNIVFLGECGRLDTYCCLDVNAKTMQPEPGSLENGASLNGLIYLQ